MKMISKILLCGILITALTLSAVSIEGSLSVETNQSQSSCGSCSPKKTDSNRRK